LTRVVEGLVLARLDRVRVLEGGRSPPAAVSGTYRHSLIGKRALVTDSWCPELLRSEQRRLLPRFSDCSKVRNHGEETTLLDANLWRRILGVDRATVIESVEGDEETDALVVRVRPRRATKRRCGRCGVRSPGLRPGRRATSLALSRPRTEFGASVRHERRRRVM